MERGDLLCVIIDCNALWWGRLIQSQPGFPPETTLASCVASVSTFCNAHILRNPNNKLLMLSAGPENDSSPVLYNSDSNESSDFEITEVLRNKMMKKLKCQNKDFGKETRIAPALSLALCYTNRLQKAKSQIAGARILILKLSDDTTTQHLNLMSCFFAAQKQGISLDSCLLAQDSALMQQACDITGGQFAKVEHTEEFLQTLLTLFLLNPSERVMCERSTAGNVDYRPACFCHQRLVDLGWVCSICLSVFCQFTPICPTCQTVFKVLPVLPRPKKRKKTKE